ncbi:MAG: flagellar export chaperone FlgN [Chlamydiales bacterium]|nr:flagellar export chaperone FlgN [Chlamydiia bacterium]MCP5507813.1 flagellar export chaperone FlgN [Chlamydiales bacterium]
MVDTREDVKEQLHQALVLEIKTLRNLLTSLKDECHAITAGDLHMLDEVMDERVVLLSSFEAYSNVIINALRILNSEGVIVIPEERDLGHRNAVTLLEELLEIDDFEVASLRTQVLNLLDEIEKQNNLNAIRLKENNHRLAYEPRSSSIHDNPLHVTDGAYVEQPMKTTVMVMDIERTS